MGTNIMQKLSLFNFLTFVILFQLTSHMTNSARLTRAIMMSMAHNTNFNCTDLTITEKNLTASIILSGTVTTCDNIQAGTYKCSLQIWRIMKGQKLAKDLLTVQTATPFFSFYRKTFVDVYGLGNRAYCYSNVKSDDTRIFFLNRSNDRLVLSASLLRITLTNLQNTQDVIDGKKIIEVPKKPMDPCLMVLCGFGAHCEAVNGRPNCVCPNVSCDGDGVDLNTPVCGSDGVTYPDECRVEAAQCQAQKRITVASVGACVPVIDDNQCEDISCGFSAVCVLHTNKDDVTTPTCECPTCDGVLEADVCGSDQRTYSSECALLRTSCLEARNITIVRRSACNLCGGPEVCPGSCSFDDVTKEAVCCDDIPCRGSATGLVCGSDGNTFESRCAMERYSCKIARTITVVQEGACPPKKAMTRAVGSVSLQADGDCPGQCHFKDRRFKRFISQFERSTNEKLAMQNDKDADGRIIEKLRVVEVKKGSVVLVFEVQVSTHSQPISIDQKLDEAPEWVDSRLFGDNGAIIETVNELDLEVTKNSVNRVFVEDVCLDLQCDHGSACSIRKSDGVLVPTCSCDSIGNGNNTAVDMACLRASYGTAHVTVFANSLSARKQSCDKRIVYTFKDGCAAEAEADPCAGIGGCKGPGQVCMLVNGRPSCGCVTCEDVVDPVCGSDGQTYRSECEMKRLNCVHGRNVRLQTIGDCEDPCDDVTCDFGAKCESKNGAAECVCPAQCPQSRAPVCGSDCVTYDNQCQMTAESCKMRSDISLLHRGPCREFDSCSEGSGIEGSGSEGSKAEIEGSAEACKCKFGATCDLMTDDDEMDCVCSFSCVDSSSNPVCGSDGVTYSSECDLNRAQCDQQRSITIVKQEACDAAKEEEEKEKGEECRCNPHGSFSLSCNAVTGQCACRPGVGGQHCDRCDPGFWHFRALADGSSSGCTACGCHGDGSTRDDCDQMTGQCKCKEEVVGLKCDKCEEERATLTSSGCIIRVSTSPPLPPSTAATTISSSDAESPAEEIEMSGRSDCGLSDDEDCLSSGDYGPDSVSNLESTVHVIDSPSVEAPTTTTSRPTTTTSRPTTTTSRPTTTTSRPTTTTSRPTTTTSPATTTTSPATTTTSQPSTTISATPFSMTGDFLESNIKLPYREELLDPGSETFREYTRVITSKMNEYLKNPNLIGKVKKFDVESYVKYSHFWYGNGLTVNFLLYLDPNFSSNDVQNELNKASNREHGFEITEASNVSSTFTNHQSSETLKSNQTSRYNEGSAWSIAQFGGSSYQEFPPVASLTTTTVRIRFRSFDSEGLLFFSAKGQSGRDFVSIAIREGRVEFRFDTGTGTFLLVSHLQVDDHQWHDVLARRNRRDGMLSVDDEKPSHGTSPPGSIALDINSSLFVGGVSSEFETQVQRQVFVGKGLTGCIESVSMQGKVLPLASESPDRIAAYRISECVSSPCSPNPCKNSANCFVKKLGEAFSTKCDCKGGFEGELCSGTITPCSKLNCHPSSSCRIPRNQEEAVCDCASGRAGDRCQHETPPQTSSTVMPAFAGDSYLIRKSMGEHVKYRMVIDVAFYASQGEGLIFYNSQTNTGVGDFVALYLMKKHLIFMFSLGGGIVRIKSSRAITLNSWHEARLSRQREIGRMSIDGHSPDMGKSQDGYAELDVEEHLYLGGVPSNVKTPIKSGIVQGLIGALQKFQVNGVDVDLSISNTPETLYNVQPFNAHPCYHNPCRHEGTCVPHLGEYQCSCVAGRHGRHCDKKGRKTITCNSAC